VTASTSPSQPLGHGDRVLVFDGPSNVRDLGGLPTGDGGVTRRGQFYRADGLHELSRADLARFAELDIGLVIDLRSQAEREALPDAVDSVHVPLIADTGATPPSFDAMTTTADGIAYLTHVYRALIEEAAPAVGRVIELLARSERPALFHCMAGKDRTGVIAALLLDLADVPRPVILEEYAHTASARRAAHVAESMARMLGRGLAPEAAAGVLGAPTEVMDAMLDLVRARAGSTERYLVEHAAVPADAVALLRTRLVSPSPQSQ